MPLLLVHSIDFLKNTIAKYATTLLLLPPKHHLPFQTVWEILITKGEHSQSLNLPESKVLAELLHYLQLMQCWLTGNVSGISAFLERQSTSVLPRKSYQYIEHHIENIQKNAHYIFESWLDQVQSRKSFLDILQGYQCPPMHQELTLILREMWHAVQETEIQNHPERFYLFLLKFFQNLSEENTLSIVELITQFTPTPDIQAKYLTLKNSIDEALRPEQSREIIAYHIQYAEHRLRIYQQLAYKEHELSELTYQSIFPH